jgi:outer membrane protein with beta-barrel domain
MRHISFVVTFALGFGQALAAQVPLPSPRFGITVGVNLAKLAGDSVQGSKTRTGFVGGATLVLPLSRDFAFEPELVYSMKGSKFDEQGVSGSFKLNYVELPILIRYTFPVVGSTKPFLLAGPALAFQTSCKISGENQGATVTFGCKDFFQQVGANVDVKKFDTGAMFGGGVAFDVGGRMMSLGVRYNLGLTDVFSDTDAKNRVLSFVGTWEWALRR